MKTLESAFFIFIKFHNKPLTAMKIFTIAGKMPKLTVVSVWKIFINIKCQYLVENSTKQT